MIHTIILPLLLCVIFLCCLIIIGICFTELINENDTDNTNNKESLTVNEGNIDYMYHLGCLYPKQNKLDEAKKYYLIAIEKGNADAMINLGNLYQMLNKLEDNKQRCLFRDGNIFKAIIKYFMIYLPIVKDNLRNAIKYYLMAIERGNTDALHILATLYLKQNKLDEAEKYYLMAIEKGYNVAIYHLANLYIAYDEIERAKKYFLMAVQKGSLDAMLNLEYLYKYKKLELYSILVNIEDKNKLINDKLIELEKYKVVFCYKNKINFNSKIGECSICLDDNIKLIPLECTHYYCTECYIKLDKCPVCRM